MSYSESEGEIIFFSQIRHELDNFSDQFRSEVDAKGSEYLGPYPLPEVDSAELARFLIHIKDPDSDEAPDRDLLEEWLFDIVSNKKNLETLISASEENSSIFGRRYQIFGDHAIKTALSREIPEEVFAAAQIDWQEYDKGSGHDPYTWDPNVDHIPTHPDGPW
ncbi:hypothetical protein ACNO8S_09545 [Haloarcula sp. KBTZ06]|uniref:hypothetical protein n=1 Tax=Haloarcula sp. KBTZ06 TaxID=3402682 RepID=UPI003B433F97